MYKHFNILFILIITSFSSAVVIGQDTVKITYMTENYPPANFTINGELKGVSVEILKLMWDKLGYTEQPIKIVPWARGYKWAQTRKNHVLFTMSRTKEREHLFKWVGPIFASRQVLFGLPKKNMIINSLGDAKKYTIGTIRDDVCETALLQAGFDRKKLKSVADMSHNIKKLIANRVDLVCQSEQSFIKLIKIHNYDPKQFKEHLIVTEINNYYAFNKETSDVVIQIFQNIFNKLKKERKEILKRYDMEL